MAASSMSEGMATAKRSPEMRAATEFAGRCLRSRSPICPIAWSPTCMPKFSLMTCSSSMSTYNRLQRRSRDSASLNMQLDALFERGARQQSGQCVVAGFDAGGHAAGEQVGEMHVAPDEFGRVEFAKQRQHAGGAAAALAQRTGQDAIRNRHLPGLRGDPVDHQRIAPRLRDRQQLFLRARENRRVGVFRPGECQALVGHHDAGEHALEMPGGVGEQRLQIVGAAGLRVAAGHRQQQLEILVAGGQVLVEFLDVGARQQVTAQQLQRRLQVLEHVGERQQVRVLGLRAAHHGHHRGQRHRVRHAARIDRPGASSGRAACCPTRARVLERAFELRDGLQHQREQFRIGVGDARPEKLAGVIEQAQRRRARQQRAHQLRVRLHGGFEGHQPWTIAQLRPYDVDAVGVFAFSGP